VKKSKRVGRERFAAANGDSPEFAINVETGKAGNTMSNLPQFVIVLRVHWACEVLTFWLVLALVAVAPANAQERNLAPGFKAIAPDARIAIIPTDIELFEVSAGGLLEPKADWTEAATRHFKAALVERKKSFGAATVELTERDQDEVAEINALHAAVARSIAAHHFGLGFLRLPTKDDKLDWSMGEAVRIIKDKTGANYALFTWMRDSYASSERIAATVLLALLGVGLAPGGAQIGYASLVDLNTGQVLWFNHLMRGMGDLREADKAKETLEALLAQFPALK
jgi:hypothetical protein